MLDKINFILNEVLGIPIKKFIVDHKKERYRHSEVYKNANTAAKADLLFAETKKIFQGLNKFKLNFYGIYALKELVDRERKIQAFMAHEYFKVWVVYRVGGIEFVAFYPSVFDKDTIKEMDDLLADLKSNKYHHIVNSYTTREAEKEPPEPVTTAQLQYSAFYIFDLQPQTTMKLAGKLHEAGLITSPITDGWLIPDESVETIITHLNSLYAVEIADNYDDSIVLQYKRQYSGVDNEKSQIAIIPHRFLGKYAPEKIHESPEFISAKFSEDEAKDAKKIYEYIYKFTLSTQMSAAKYDVSTVKIAVGQRELKQTANVIIAHRNEDGSVRVLDGWERIAGDMYKKREKAIDGREDKDVILPRLEDGMMLRPIDIGHSVITAKRPPRYGVGRFIVQVLEKYGIGNPATYDDVIAGLIEAKLVTLVGKILTPTDNALLLYKWLEQYCPDLTVIEQMKYHLDKWNAVFAEELTEDSVLNEFSEMLESAVGSSGYVAEDAVPTDAKIKLVKAIAAKNNVALPDLNSSLSCDLFLQKYPEEEYKSIGRCPKCNANVLLREWISQDGGVSHFFACENRTSKGGCSFALWDSDIKKYFSDKGYDLDRLQERIDLMTKILSKQQNKIKGFRIDGLIAKNKSTYSARVFLKSYQDEKSKSQKWCFGLEFVNTRGQK